TARGIFTSSSPALQCAEAGIAKVKQQITLCFVKHLMAERQQQVEHEAKACQRIHKGSRAILLRSSRRLLCCDEAGREKGCPNQSAGPAESIGEPIFAFFSSLVCIVQTRGEHHLYSDDRQGDEKPRREDHFGAIGKHDGREILGYGAEQADVDQPDREGQAYGQPVDSYRAKIGGGELRM